MANEQNLKPQNTRTAEERKAVAIAGGKASGEARRRAKRFKEYVRLALNSEVTNPATGESISLKDAMAHKLVQQAVKGNLNAVKMVLEVIEEKPAEKLELSGKVNNVLRVQFCEGTGQSPVIEDT